MKIAVQSLISSATIHFVYLISMILTGYIQTMNYTPDTTSAWNKATTLQSEVVFGQSNSPLFYLFTFVGVAVICGVIIISYRKIAKLH